MHCQNHFKVSLCVYKDVFNVIHHYQLVLVSISKNHKLKGRITFFFSLMCFTHLDVFATFILIRSGKNNYRLWSLILCIFHHDSVTFLHLRLKSYPQHSIFRLTQRCFKLYIHTKKQAYLYIICILHFAHCVLFIVVLCLMVIRLLIYCYLLYFWNSLDFLFWGW